MEVEVDVDEAAATDLGIFFSLFFLFSCSLSHFRFGICVIFTFVVNGMLFCGLLISVLPLWKVC